MKNFIYFQHPVRAIALSLLTAIIFLNSENAISQTLKDYGNKQINTLQGFIENKGQIIDQNNEPNTAVKYLLKMPGMNVQLRANGFSYDTYVIEKKKNEKNTQGSLAIMDEYDNIIYNFHRIDVEFVGASSQPQIIAEEPGSDYLNYYTSSLPDTGATYVHHYGKVIYKNLYPLIDLEFFAQPGTNKPVEYKFIVHPGADPSLIRWKYLGSNDIKSEGGNILIQTAHGNLNESIPFTYEYENGKPVVLNYIRSKNGIFAFDIKDYNKQNTLIIDPVPNISWATYYGGSSTDQGYSLKTDASKNIFVTGYTQSSSGIATTGAYQTTYGGNNDVFVSMFNSSGSRMWATYFGGTNFENGNAYGGNLYDNGGGLALDPGGNIYITGFSNSTASIATTGAYQTSLGGSYDAFLAKFSSSGTRLWSTYLGGSAIDMGYGVASDTSGNVYVTGRTGSSSGISTSGAYLTSYAGGTFDAFISKFSPAGSIIWSTYYGGSGEDMGKDISLDLNGNVIVTGYSASTSGIATSGAYQTSNAGSNDAFIVKFSSTGSIIWGTFYGGSLADYGQGSTTDASGNVYATGYTVSTSGIATTGSYQTSYGGGTSDAFVVKFSPAGARLWGTYIGGSLAEFGRCMTMDPGGNVLVTGYTASTTGMATSGTYQTSYGGGNFDGFVSKFNPSGGLQWCTYYGGSTQDNSLGITTDISGNIYITGQSNSTSGIATTGAYQTSNAGSYDAFLAKFQGQPVVITSVTAIQPDTTGVITGSTNKMIIGVKIFTTGTDTMAKVTRFSFDTAGAFNYSNITGTAKVYYTGNSSTFSTGNLFGSTSGTPSAAFTITGNKTVDTGVVYFWLTFDVSSTATIGNYLDAKCTQVRWDSAGSTVYKTPVITSPAGKRRIIAPPKTLNSITFTQPSTSNVYRNSTNNPVLRIDINVTGTSGTLYFSQITVAANNTSSTDVTNVKLFATATTTFSSSTQLGSTMTFSGGLATFTSLNYSLPTGNTYIWITYDIPTTATVYDTVDAKIPANGITIGGNTYPSSMQNPAGNRIINTSSQYDAGITAIVSPSAPYCKTFQSVKVTLKNYGTSTLTSDTIKWTVNGASQSPYFWSGSLTYGSTSNVTLGSYTFSTGTSYTIKVFTTKRINGTYIDSFPGNDTALVNITFNPIPVAGFTVNDTFQCFKGNSFIFTNTSAISSGTFTSNWNFGDLTSSVLTSPSHSYLTLSSFPVKLVVTSLMGCKDSIIKNVALKPSPVTAFSINDTSQCFRGNSFSFTNNSSISSGTFTNLWKFGDNTTTTSASPTHSYLSPGTFQVKLITTSNNNCKDSIARNVYVRPHPLAAFTVNDSDQCHNSNSFVFTNITTIASGTFTSFWNFGDTTTSTSTSPSKSYTYTGIHVVKLVTSSNYGCKDSTNGNTYILISPKSAFNIISDSSQCLFGNLYSFLNNSSIISGTFTNFWNFGDMTTSANTSPTKSYSSAGTYNVKLVITSNLGCKDSITKKVYVRPSPVPGFTINNTSQCLRGNSFIINNTTTIPTGTFSNVWYFGDSTTSTMISPVKTYLYAGTFKIKVVATSNYGCKDSLDGIVTVRPHPVSAFAVNDTDQCFIGHVFGFTNNSTVSSGTFTSLWKFGDNTTSTAITPIHSYLTFGTYTVKLVNTSNYGCKDSTQKKVYVYASPQASFTIPVNKQCLRGNLFTFNNTSVIVSGTMTYLWKFGDNTTSTTTNTTHTYLTGNTFTVKLIALSNKSCADSTTATVTVCPQPQAGFILNDSTQCFRNNLFQFTDDSKITGDIISTWVWKFGDGNSVNLKNTSHSYLLVNTYSFRHIVTSSNGCKDSISGKVYVYPMPTAAFTVNDTSQCSKGNLFIFSNTSTGVTLSYLWMFGDGNTSTDTNTTHAYANSGYYNVRLAAITSDNCIDTFGMNIHVRETPVVNLGKDTIIDDNKSITLDAGGGFGSYLWSNSATSRAIVIDSNGIGLHTKLFWVKVRQNGCDGYDSINITFKKHVSINDLQSNNYINVYPNPTIDFINIEYGLIRKDMVVTLTDMNGKFLMSIHLKSVDNNNSYQLNISDLAEGVYYLNFSNSEISRVIKVVKF